MKKSSKRLVAILCAIVMVLGGCFVADGMNTKASSTTAQTEWVLANKTSLNFTSGADGVSTYTTVDSDEPGARLECMKINEGTTSVSANKIGLGINVSEYEASELALAFWCYSATAGTLGTGGAFRLASHTSVQKNFIMYGMKSISLQAGWNYIKLPLDAWSSGGQGDFTLSNINAFGFTSYANTNGSMRYFTDFKLVLIETTADDETFKVGEYGSAKPGVAPTAGVPDGYRFAGWYTDKACTEVLKTETTGKVFAKFVEKDVLSVKTQYVTHKDPLMLEDCDDTDGIQLHTGSITTTNAEFNEGSGAIKLTTDGLTRAHFSWKTGINLSKYTSEGALYFQFYIDVPDEITKSLIVDIGHDLSNMHRWVIDKSQLNAGWNQMILKFSQVNSKVGTVDYSNINMFRVTQSSASDANPKNVLTTYVDDIRVLKGTTAPAADEYADIRFVTTVDTIYYRNVGFKFEINGGSTEISSKNVYSTLFQVSSSGDADEITPDVFSSVSTYFMTHTLTNIPDTAFDTEIKVTPFWTTQDGTKVYGEPITRTINEEKALTNSNVNN